MSSSFHSSIKREGIEKFPIPSDIYYYALSVDPPKTIQNLLILPASLLDYLELHVVSPPFLAQLGLLESWLMSCLF